MPAESEPLGAGIRAARTLAVTSSPGAVATAVLSVIGSLFALVFPLLLTIEDRRRWLRRYSVIAVIALSAGVSVALPLGLEFGPIAAIGGATAAAGLVMAVAYGMAWAWTQARYYLALSSIMAAPVFALSTNALASQGLIRGNARIGLTLLGVVLCLSGFGWFVRER